MILGSVHTNEPRIRLIVQGARGIEVEISGVIDTGYTGWLSLPPEVVASLELEWNHFDQGVLADGSTCQFDVYVANVIWDGRVREVFVDESTSAPLIGMALLKGYELKVQVRSRGRVVLKKMS